MNTENEVKGTVLKYDGEVIATASECNGDIIATEELTSNNGSFKGFTSAEYYLLTVKSLLLSQLSLMRKAFPDSDAWYCGSATIDDLSKCGNLSFVFGSEEDVEFVKEGSDVYVEIPYDVANDNINNGVD
jgi:hypothetical protein